MDSLTTVDPSALGRRLAARLEEKGWTYKEFQQRVRSATRGARGTSYGSVWSYVNGEVAEPRPRVVRAMAEVLGLSTDWLTSGEGPRTSGEVARDVLAQGDVDEKRTRHLGMLLRAMEMARARLSPMEREVLARRDHVVEDFVVDLLESGGRGLETYGEGEVAEAFVLVAWLLALPARIMGAGGTGSQPRGGEAYVLAMTAALRTAMPRSPRGHPYNVLSGLRRLRGATGHTGYAAPATESEPRPGGGIGTAH